MYYFLVNVKKVDGGKIVIRCYNYLNIQFRNPGYLNEEVNRSNLICRPIETLYKILLASASWKDLKARRLRYKKIKLQSEHPI